MRVKCRFCERGSWSREAPRGYGEVYRHYRVFHNQTTAYSYWQADTDLSVDVQRREDRPSSVWCPYGCGVKNTPAFVWWHTYADHQWAVDSHSFPEVRWRTEPVSPEGEEMLRLIVARLVIGEVHGADPPSHLSRRHVVVLGRGGVEDGWRLGDDDHLGSTLEVHLELIRGQIPWEGTFNYAVTDSN